MNMDEKIQRINELYRLSKERGLTDQEKDEQAKLRKDYIDSVKNGLRQQLDNISIVEPDGSISELKNRGNL